MVQTFALEVVRIDPDRPSLTFKVKSLDGVRRMAVSRYFVLRALAWSRRGDWGICRALKPLLASLSLSQQAERLGDPQFVDTFIIGTRITAIEHYIDWQNIDHVDALEKMIVAMNLETSYHLEVTLRDPAHLARIKVGDPLKSEDADRYLKVDPANLYTYKRDDEHWYLHELLAGHGEPGDHTIAWTNAHDAVLARTHGVLPWREGDRWGAVDRDGARCVRSIYSDVDFQNDGLVFKVHGRWIPLAELPQDDPSAEASSAFSDPDRPIEARADLGTRRRKSSSR